jgi:N-hydroxyarylamine O-acetyltransferase
VERIGYRGSLEPTADTLRELHRAHLLTVPFENLDIHLGRAIVLSIPAMFDKIVRRRRGGFCYELNGMFGWLLEQLGFTVSLLSARVYDGGQPGPEFDHLVLLVSLDGPVIADVGFGDCFVEPLPLNAGNPIMQQGTGYRLTTSDVGTVLERRREGDWEPQYVFSLVPHELAEFAAMCRWQQSAPESIFTRKTVCSMATPDGRITLSGRRFIATMGGRREERDVPDDQEYRALLMSRFGIDLG